MALKSAVPTGSEVENEAARLADKGLAALGYLQFQVAKAPAVEGVPIPTLLLVVGLLGGVVLAGIGLDFEDATGNPGADRGLLHRLDQ